MTTNPSSTSPENDPQARLAKRTRPHRQTHERGDVSPIEQAEQLRASLREAMTKTNQLIASLKCQQKQSKVVASTLASLKHLQAIGA